MLKFIFRRLLYLVFVLMGVSLIVFTLLYFTPGDPAQMILGEAADAESIELLREEMGLNDSYIVQYGNYILNIVLHQDLGISYITNTPVMDEILEVFPNTIKLSFIAVCIAIITGTIFGVVSAVKQYSIIDNIVMVTALLGVSAPTFWIGVLMLLLFSVKLGWLPPSGFDTPKQMIMPAVALSLKSTAIIARMTRSSMLEVIRMDYIKTARAKGQKEYKVIMDHAFRNALIPIITVAGLQFGIMLGGALICESIFSIPGLGRLMIDAIKMRDYPVVQGGVLIVATCFTLVTLAVDILYAFVDPRIAKS